MTSAAGEYGLHSLHVLDVEFPHGVVMLDSFNPVQAKLFDEVYSVGDRIA